MPDQANRLRELIHARTYAHSPPTSGAAPRLVAIAGGKGGVGTTTVAVNLAIAVAQDGRRTLLVDADACRSDVAAHCGLTEGDCLSDVLAGRRSLHEALHRGPAGMQVLPGRWADAASDWSSPAVERLLHNLRSLGQHCDVVLLDVGAAVGPLARCWWRAADLVVVVTAPDNVSVMDAYASVKTILDTADPVRVATLVNQATDEARAAEVHDRLRRACQRFLGIDVSALGSIPHDPKVQAAAAVAEPLMLYAPGCDAAERIARLPSGLGLSAGTAREAAAGMATK